MPPEKPKQQTQKEYAEALLSLLEETVVSAVSAIKGSAKLLDFLSTETSDSISTKKVLEKTKTPETKDEITKQIHEKTDTAETFNNVR